MTLILRGPRFRDQDVTQFEHDTGCCLSRCDRQKDHHDQKLACQPPDKPCVEFTLIYVPVLGHLTTAFMIIVELRRAN